MKAAHVISMLIIAGVIVAVSKAPRGIRNNNPGNIRKSDSAWVGKMRGLDQDFETFDSPENGIRALVVLLKNYMKTGNDTVRKIINKYAPSNENDTSAYVAKVSEMVGVSPDFPLDERHLRSLVIAIIKHENGRNPYTVAQIDAGISRA